MNAKQEMNEHVIRLQGYIIEMNDSMSWCMGKITEHTIEIMELRKEVKKLNDCLINNVKTT